MAIMPDFNRYLGYSRDYTLTGEDYDEIPQEVRREHLVAIEDAKNDSSGGLGGGSSNNRLHD